jgi:branched-chain amino acid transport system ATP-binding protein
MLKGRGVTKRFGGLVALNGLNFHLEEGEVVGLIGPNGSGKTTLFNVICGFLRPDRGEIYLNGRRIDGKRPYHISKLGIGRTFQIVRPLADLTVLQNVAVGVLYGREGTSDMKKAQRRAMEILDFTGLSHRRAEVARRLPLVDRKRLEVARALATEPTLLLLDEVFAGLNPAEMEAAIELVERIRSELKITIFMVEHVMKAIMRSCDRIIAIHHGEKIAEGTPQQIANDTHVIEAYLGTAYAEYL